MRKCLSALIGISILFGGLGGQEVTDTLQITIEGDLAGVAFQSFEVELRIGDTVTYVAQAVDSEGDPVTSGVVYTYASSDTTLLVIDAITGFATALRKGNMEVIVRAEYGGLETWTASFRDGDLNWTGHDKVPLHLWEPSLGDSTWYAAEDRWVYDQTPVPNPDPTLQFCLYIVDARGYLVGQSVPPPTCPLAIAERPTSPAYPMFASISRVRPELFVFGSPG